MVGKLKVEGERDGDEPEDRQLAVQPDVSGELDRALVRLRLEPVEVDAGLDLDAAGGDAEVDGDGRAELERRFDLVDAGRRDADREEAAAAEQETVRLKDAAARRS